MCNELWGAMFASHWSRYDISMYIPSYPIILVTNHTYLRSINFPIYFPTVSHDSMLGGWCIGFECFNDRHGPQTLGPLAPVAGPMGPMGPSIPRRKASRPKPKPGDQWKSGVSYGKTWKTHGKTPGKICALSIDQHGFFVYGNIVCRCFHTSLCGGSCF